MGCSDGAVNAYLDYEPNRAPQILELVSDFSGQPAPGDIMTIICRGSDPDGNPLTYAFTSSQGSFTGQAEGGGNSRITFLVGNISGGEDVSVTAKVTDSKNASVSATLNIGTSSLGPAITLEPVNTTLGADGYSTVTFRSSMDGYYQVSLADSGIPADEMDPEGYFFFIKKDTDTVFTVCGSTDSDVIDNNYTEGIPRLPAGSGTIVRIKVVDNMGQVSLREITFDVKGTMPDISNPEIRVTDLKSAGMTLNWNYATDRDNSTGDQQMGMSYRVYMSESDNISTFEDAESHGVKVMDWTPDRNYFTVTGLHPLTTYYFNVAVKDSDDLVNLYSTVEGTTGESTDTAPRVIYTIPAPGDTGVIINSDILIDFNREMNEETINSETLLLRDGDGNPVPFGLSYGSGVAAIDPADNFVQGTRYYLTVSGSIEDAGGDKLGSDYLFGFTAVLESGTYTVRYDGNGATGGTVPVDNTIYADGDIITLQGNTGNLKKTGHFFSGWNTAPDGSGTDYTGGQSLTMGSGDLLLYAKWKAGFATTWKTWNPGESAYNQVTIPVFDGETYDYTVDWGDGSVETHLTGSATHTYADPGIYTVAITGRFPRIYFNDSGDKEKILTIESWGEIVWSSMAFAFHGCTNLTYNATDAPDLSGVTEMYGMFRDASSFNGDLSNWDVSNVIITRGMFANASNFNGDISTWDVRSVTNMQYMFENATSFNGDISGWDVSSVTNMQQMFENAASFNGDLGSWKVSSVTDMQQMFENATSFNRDLSDWEVISVTQMGSMFSNATSFNGDISDWDVENVIYMNGMFHGATSFNGDINGWDVRSVTQMSGMFSNATSFNRDISDWNVSNVISMGYMFYNASSFSDHDISGWDVSSVTNHTNFSTGWGRGNREPDWPE